LTVLRLTNTYGPGNAQSDDGLDWRNPSVECVALNGLEEIGFGRPFILRQRSGYRMWYTRFDGGADIGSVTRNRPMDSTLCATTRLLASPSATRRPCPRNGGLLMFYNGNGYGRTGVGVAVAELD
jgi:hypothetical protein